MDSEQAKSEPRDLALAQDSEIVPDIVELTARFARDEYSTYGDKRRDRLMLEAHASEHLKCAQAIISTNYAQGAISLSRMHKYLANAGAVVETLAGEVLETASTRDPELTPRIDQSRRMRSARSILTLMNKYAKTVKEVQATYPRLEALTLPKVNVHLHASDPRPGPKKVAADFEAFVDEHTDSAKG